MVKEAYTVVICTRKGYALAVKWDLKFIEAQAPPTTGHSMSLHPVNFTIRGLYGAVQCAVNTTLLEFI
jgi:hypothetical protein